MLAAARFEGRRGATFTLRLREIAARVHTAATAADLFEKRH
jgi:hypothetical protein